MNKKKYKRRLNELKAIIAAQQAEIESLKKPAAKKAPAKKAAPAKKKVVRKKR